MSEGRVINRRGVVKEGKGVMISGTTKRTILEKACNDTMDVNDSSRNIMGMRSTRINGSHTCVKE